jgi:hypothetical protein
MATVMYAPDDLRVMGVCDGPGADGRCLRVVPGEEVYCRGLDLVLTGDDPRRSPEVVGRPRFRVTAGTVVCPLARLPCRIAYFSPFAPRG